MATKLGHLSNNPQLLIAELEKYENFLAENGDIFSLDGKKLEQLCKQHPQHVSTFRIKNYELKCIEDLFQSKLDKIYSDCWKKLNENNKKILTQKDIHVYIQSDPDYRQTYELVLEITYIRKKYEATVDALDALGYSLNNITKIRVAQIEDVII